VTAMKWIRANEVTSISDTYFKIGGLHEDIDYEFRVAAENRAGLGPYSEVSSPVKTYVHKGPSSVSVIPRGFLRIVFPSHHSRPSFDNCLFSFGGTDRCSIDVVVSTRTEHNGSHAVLFEFTMNWCKIILHILHVDFTLFNITVFIVF